MKSFCPTSPAAIAAAVLPRGNLIFINYILHNYVNNQHNLIMIFFGAKLVLGQIWCKFPTNRI